MPSIRVLHTSSLWVRAHLRTSSLHTLQQLRYNHTNYTKPAPAPAPAAAPTNPPLPSGLINLSSPTPARTILSLHGPDSTKFLQATTTTNIPSLLSPTFPLNARASYTAFLNAQGRLLFEGFVYNVNTCPAWRERASAVTVGLGGSGGGSGSRSGNGGPKKWTIDDPCWFIETGSDAGEGLGRWLKRYLLRSKLSITHIPSITRAGGAWDERGEGWDVYASWGGGESSLPQGILRGVPMVNDTRAPELFKRFLVPKKIDIDDLSSTRAATLSEYTLRRYLHGIAEATPLSTSPTAATATATTSSYELHPPDRALPHEYNLDLLPPPHGIDFRKGCYVGQELTVRTQHRGVVRKRVVPVQLSPLANTCIPAHHGGVEYTPDIHVPLPPPGAEAEIVSTHAAGARPGRSAGRFISGMGNIGIALVRLESLFGEGGEVGTREGGRWGSEGWKLVWEEEVVGEGGEGGVKRKRELGVRAWLPGWHFRDVSGEEGREGER